MDLFLIGLAIASMTMTISKSNIFWRLRALVSKLGLWAQDLIHCPYCLSHWLAFGFVWYEFGLFDKFLIKSFAVITIASLASWGITQLFLALERLDNEI